MRITDSERRASATVAEQAKQHQEHIHEVEIKLQCTAQRQVAGAACCRIHAPQILIVVCGEARKTKHGKELLGVCRTFGHKTVVAWGLTLGLMLGFATDFVLVAAGA